MNTFLDEKLCHDYPDIFVDRRADMRTTAMCWGFECGDGWYKIIDGLCKKLTLIHKLTGIATVATQVKEKYGTLRFNHMSQTGDTALSDAEQKVAHDIIHEITDYADSQSSITCEACGEYGRTTGYMWLTTLCENHWREKNPDAPAEQYYWTHADYERAIEDAKESE